MAVSPVADGLSQATSGAGAMGQATSKPAGPTAGGANLQPDPNDPQEDDDNEIIRFTKRMYREALKALTGIDPGREYEAHHVFPQKYEGQFEALDINIHDPHNLTWTERQGHRLWSHDYNREWEAFMATNPTRQEVLNFGRQLGRDYGFFINYP